MNIYHTKIVEDRKSPNLIPTRAKHIHLRIHNNHFNIERLKAYREQSKQSKHFKNTENIPLVHEGDAWEEVEM